jgi:hypothetical protein
MSRIRPRSRAALASDTAVTDVWVADADGHPQVRIDYSSGLYDEIGWSPPSMTSTSTAEKAYEQAASEDAASTDGKATVTSVQGVPAYPIPADATVFANGDSQHAPGSIEFVVDGQTVNIVGAVSNDDLMRRPRWPSLAQTAKWSLCPAFVLSSLPIGSR